MVESHRWTYSDAQGQAVKTPGLVEPSFPSRADAEAWLADDWQEIADAGVSSVTLMCGSDVVYGPMSLSADV